MKLLHAIFISVCLFLLPAISRAELSLGIMKDVIHDQDSYGGVLRYDYRPAHIGGILMGWGGTEHDNSAIGFDYDFIKDERVDLTFGGTYLTRINGINGTHFNFNAGLGLNIGGHCRVQYTHISNGHNKNNDGWNFIGLMYRF